TACSPSAGYPTAATVASVCKTSRMSLPSANNDAPKAMRCAPRSKPSPAAHLQRPVCRTVTDNISPDPGDRLHTAACIHGDVDVLLTRNLKHFRAPAISDAGVQVMISDTF